MKSIVLTLLICPLVNVYGSAFGIPDGDTGLLISIVGNTSEQIVRLEKLLSTSEKQLEYTKQLKEQSDALASTYDRITSIQSTLSALASVGTTRPEDLKEINDKIEEIQDQRDRLKDLIEKSKEAQAASEAISEESKVDPVKVSEVIKIDQAQIKSANSSSVNQTQVTAKNTAYINSKLTESNVLLRKNVESSSKTNALFAKNMAKQASDEKRSLEYMGVIKKDNGRK